MGTPTPEELRHTGITVIGDVLWGTHFCQFYQDKQDLIDILVPYFKAGLENNEFCMWITSEPLASDEAKSALAANVENLETYIADGQLEILDYREWYTVSGKFESDRAFQGLIDRVETATRRGFAGLRVTGNLSWLEKPDWQAFTEYEAAVNAVIGKYRVLALCAYSLSKCGAIEIMDVISNHAFALTKRAGKWERIDSAERRKVGVSLFDSEARFRALLTATSDVVYRMSPDWKEMFELRGRDFIPDSDEPTGTWLQKYIHRDDQQFVTAVIDEAIRNKSIFELEHRVLRVDGSLGWTFSRAIPIRNAEGEVVEWFGAASDITERKRAQEIENRLTSDLTASRDEIRALAASLMRAQEDERRRVSRELHDHICHQLGSLAVDIGKLIVDPLPPPKNARAQLEAIQARVVKTSQEAHDIAYKMHTAILDDLGLVASLKDLCSQFSEHHPDIVLDFEDSGPPASIPSEMASCLYRVAQESLQNIAKHSRAKCVSVRLDFKKEAVVLTIQDDGAGFDPKAVKGHGRLGLISMKERAHLVNGKLTITAELGHGTRIALKVPLPVQQLIERPRVLLADDHPVVLEEIRSVLAPNYEIVETVADGRALVEAALRLKPDLIVADITMPLLNGIDAAVQIKKSLPGMKLLFVTMHASTAYVKAAFEAGGTGYVLKSGLRDELPDAVQSVLGGRTYVSHGLSTEYPERLQDPTRAPALSVRTSARDDTSHR